MSGDRRELGEGDAEIQKPINYWKGRVMKYITVLVLALLCLGCAGPQLMDPEARETMTTGGMGDIKYFVQLYRVYDIVEGKETRRGVEFLPTYGESTQLKSGTKELAIVLRVLNPKKQEFSLWETFYVAYENETYPYQITHQLYGGELSVYEFSKPLPLSNVRAGTYWLAIKGRNGESMFEVGPIKYNPYGGTK